MKVLIDRDPALKAMARTQAATPGSKNTIPILGNVLLMADGERLQFICTNLDQECRDAAPCSVEQPGQITVDAKRLHDMLRAQPSGAEIELSYDPKGADQRLLARCGRSRSRIATLPAADFPALPRDGVKASVTLSPKTLTKLLDQTLFAVSAEETRYYLNGANFLVRGDELLSVSTDGHRLAVCQVKHLGSEGEWAGSIIPTAALVQIHKLLEGVTTEVTLRQTGHLLTAQLGEALLITKLIDGAYPQWENVIPRANDKLIGIDSRVFENALKRMAVFATDKHSSVTFKLEPGVLHMRGRGEVGDETDEDVEAEYDGEPLEISFSAKYLIQALAHVAGPRVSIALADAMTPALITDPLDSQTRFINVPLRT